MSNTYDPIKANDERFAGFKNLKIDFLEGSNGWAWRAVNSAHYEASSSGYQDLEAAIHNCLTTLQNEPLVVISAPQEPIGAPKGKLAKYLKGWDKKFKA